MDYQMRFAKLATYDPGLPGITVETTLSLSGAFVSLAAKLDTGSTNCIFARRHGESLGLDIERGVPLRIRTAAGSFSAYSHEVTLEVLGFSFDARVCFAADAAFDRDVLGRFGFLDRVCLGLVDYEGKLYLSNFGDQ